MFELRQNEVKKALGSHLKNIASPCVRDAHVFLFANKVSWPNKIKDRNRSIYQLSFGDCPYKKLVKLEIV